MHYYEYIHDQLDCNDCMELYIDYHQIRVKHGKFMSRLGIVLTDAHKYIALRDLCTVRQSQIGFLEDSRVCIFIHIRGHSVLSDRLGTGPGTGSKVSIVSCIYKLHYI